MWEFPRTGQQTILLVNNKFAPVDMDNPFGKRVSYIMKLPSNCFKRFLRRQVSQIPKRLGGNFQRIFDLGVPWSRGFLWP